MPELPAKIIPRNNLNNILSGGFDKKLILINAAIGYGKTVFLSDFLISNIKKTAWISCTVSMQDFKVFARYLILALKEVIPGFGSNSETYIENCEKISPVDFISIFTSEYLEHNKRETVLVLDDFHLIAAKDDENNSEEIIRLIVENLPTGLKIVISSRHTVNFSLSKLRAKREVLEIRNDDFRILLQEYDAIAKLIYNFDLGNEDIKLLDNLCQGWITAAHFYIQQMKSSNRVDAGDVKNQINEYLAEDFFKSLNSLYKTFLLKCAHVEELSGAVCTKITGDVNSEKILQELYNKNIFLEKRHNESFVIQKSFKMFLEAEQERFYSKPELYDLFKTTANLYSSAGLIASAAELFIKAGFHSETIEILYDNFNGLLSSGQVLICTNYIETLQNNINKNDPRLDYMDAYIKLKYLKNYPDSENLISHILTSENPETEIYLKTNILKAELCLVNSEFEDAYDIVNNMLRDDLKSRNKSEIILLAGRVFFRKGQKFYDKAINLIENFLDSERDNAEGYSFSTENLAEIYNLLANIYSDSGLFIKATVYYEKSISAGKDILKNYKAINNNINVLCFTANFNKAYQMLNSSDEIYRNYPINRFKISNLNSHEILAYHSGDFENAIKYNKLLFEISNDKTWLNHKWIAQYIISESYIYLGETEKARQNFELLHELKDKNPLFLILNNYLKARLGLAENEKEKFYRDAYDYYEKMNFRHFTAQVSFALGLLFLENDDYLTASTYISNSLINANKLSYKYFLLNEIPVSRAAFDFAIVNNIEKKFVLSLYNDFREKRNYEWLSEGCKVRIISEINKLTDIKFLPFGNTEFRLRGEPVPEDKWIRKKSKVLLAYLMSDPERIHTKDEIIDMFFGDMPADKADTAYHSTLYNIRTALKIYDIKTDKPKRSKDKTYDYNPQYILYEDKTIRLNHDFYYESANIEFEKLFSKSRLTSISADEKGEFISKAIEIYKGDFMPGYYDSWCEELRTKYKNNYIILCEELINILEGNANYEEVIKYCELLLNEDKLNDSAHISIINAYSKLGNLNMAKNRSRLMLKIYDEELGEKPQPKTLENINSILS